MALDLATLSPYMRTVVEHFDHNAPVAGCDHCEVSPMIADIHRAYFAGHAPAIYTLADGYGEPGLIPEQGYDWSGVRDSTPAAVRAMHALVTEKGW